MNFQEGVLLLSSQEQKLYVSFRVRECAFEATEEQ